MTVERSAHQSHSAGDAGEPPGPPGAERAAWEPGFNELLLGAVVLLGLIAALVGIGWYLLPGDQLQVPELQPAARVTRVADFPVGASRMISWGDRVVLVVRSGERDYSALQGTAPLDGCLLEWDAVALRVTSPCNFLVYDLDGNVVRGLTTVPLQRYTTFVRDGAVYVTEHR